MKCKGCGITFKPKGARSYRQKFCQISCRVKFFAKKHRNNDNQRYNPLQKSVFEKDTRVKRFCLKCDRGFLSWGIFNRICDDCKNKVEFDGGSILYAKL
jgi:hypothetical protein